MDPIILVPMVLGIWTSAVINYAKLIAMLTVLLLWTSRGGLRG